MFLIVTKRLFVAPANFQNDKLLARSRRIIRITS
jgi:hypothetical protein